MPTHVALLRAINVGGHTVKMDHLRSLFVTLGYAQVETFIASGNVIFDCRTKNVSALERRIANGLATALGYEVATFVRTITELETVAAHKPFPEAELSAEGNILYIGFGSQELDQQARLRLESLSNEVNDFSVSGREIYWLRRTKAGESDYAGGLIEKVVGQPLTFRSENTIRKIAAKYHK